MKMKTILYLFTGLILLCMATSCNILDRSGTTSKETTADSGSQETAEENKEAENNNTEEVISGANEDALSDQIIITYPLPDELITSPLIITGKARGTWFFEATFPVSLLDSNENILTLHYGTTEEEWMTEDFISFTATIEFDDPQTATGFLVLEKNNLSDIREYDAEIIIPVRFE